MQISVKLQDPFSYSVWPIILVLFVFLAVVIYLIYLIVNNKNKRKNNVFNYVPPKNLFQIKNQYLQELDNLHFKINQNQISIRKSYQTLSLIIRNFVYEVTDIEVQKYTLEEIKKINIPILTELIAEYYPPAFSLLSEGNIINSLNKTREVIRRWN